MAQVRHNTGFAMVEALVGWVAGAVLVSETEKMVRRAGLRKIELAPNPDILREGASAGRGVESHPAFGPAGFGENDTRVHSRQ